MQSNLVPQRFALRDGRLKARLLDWLADEGIHTDDGIRLIDPLDGHLA